MNRPIRLGVVIDPIEDIEPKKDSSFGDAPVRPVTGLGVRYAELSHLYLRDGVPMGRWAPLTVRADANDWFTRGECGRPGFSGSGRRSDAQGPAF
jgi:glutathione synthase